MSPPPQKSPDRAGLTEIQKPSYHFPFVSLFLSPSLSLAVWAPHYLTPPGFRARHGRPAALTSSSDPSGTRSLDAQLLKAKASKLFILVKELRKKKGGNVPPNRLKGFPQESPAPVETKPLLGVLERHLIGNKQNKMTSLRGRA